MSMGEFHVTIPRMRKSGVVHREVKLASSGEGR